MPVQSEFPCLEAILCPCTFRSNISTRKLSRGRRHYLRIISIESVSWIVLRLWFYLKDMKQSFESFLRQRLPT